MQDVTSVKTNTIRQKRTEDQVCYKSYGEEDFTKTLIVSTTTGGSPELGEGQVM